MDVLTNKKYITRQRLSRYDEFPVYFNTLDNKWVMGTDAWLADDTTYSLHKVEEGEDLDILALKYYNNPVYYWIIASFNRIQDPFVQLTPGNYLKIPVISFISYIDE